MRGTGIQLNEDLDLAISVKTDANGKILSGLKVGDTLYQNQALLLLVHPGELKEAPVMGVGISDSLLDDNQLYWRKRIREQLELDSQVVNEVSFVNKNPVIDAKY